MARITLYGMLQYDSNLFDGVVLSNGLEKELLINEIISKSGDLFPYYQVPPILKQNISYWFIRRRFDFEQIYKALRTDYNPLENYDRYEEISRDYTNSGADKTKRDYSNLGSSTDTLGVKNVTSEGVSAYDSATYTPRSQTDSQNSGTNKNETASKSSDNATMEYGAKRNEVESNHIHGNIGVTTSSAMATEAVALRLSHDMYRIIADMFEKEFILQIY